MREGGTDEQASLYLLRDLLYMCVLVDKRVHLHPSLPPSLPPSLSLSPSLSPSLPPSLSPSLPPSVGVEGGHRCQGLQFLSRPPPVARGRPAGQHRNVLSWGSRRWEREGRERRREREREREREKEGGWRERDGGIGCSAVCKAAHCNVFFTVAHRLLPHQVIGTVGVVRGIDEDHDVVVQYPSRNRSAQPSPHHPGHLCPSLLPSLAASLPPS